MPLEQAIQAQISSYMSKKGFYVVKVITANRAGVPDIVACAPDGRFWAVEVKRPGQKPSKLQLAHLRMVTKAGGVALWTDSFEEFKRGFQEACF